MKNKYSHPELIVLVFFITSCTPWVKHDPQPNYPISGAKWYQVKLDVYNLSYSGIRSNDTIYQKSAFDNAENFTQFFNTGDCHIGSGSPSVFYPSGALGRRLIQEG